MNIFSFLYGPLSKQLPWFVTNKSQEYSRLSTHYYLKKKVNGEALISVAI